MCKTLKNLYNGFRALRTQHNSGSKMDHLPQQGTFFSEKHQFKFHVPFGPFYSAKLQKKFLEWIQSYDNMPFSGKNGPLAPNDFFFQVNP